MPRVLHTKQAMLGKYPLTPVSANDADLTWLAANATDKEEVVLTGREMVLARNTGATAHTVTFTSVIDDLNRYGDITAYSIDADEVALFGPFPKRGWAQTTSNKLFFEANNAEVEFAVVTIPAL